MNASPFARFLNLLKQYKLELRQIYTYAFFIGIVNLSLPLGIQAIINYLQTGVISSSWTVLVGFVLFGITITGFLQVLQLRVVENIQQDLFARSALEFAKRGAQTVIACRRVEAGNDAAKLIRDAIPGAEVECIQLDLTDFESIFHFANVFNAKFDRLDILLNNAGATTA